MGGNISRSQINLLLRTAIEAGLSADVLEFSNRENLKRLVIPLPCRFFVKDSGLYFQINGGHSAHDTPTYDAEFFPGSRNPHFDERRYSSWDQVTRGFSTWAKTVRAELDEPDPWLLVERGNMLLGNIPEANSEIDKFSEDDVQIAQELLGRIREFLVSEAQPSAQQLLLIDERIRFLEESAKVQDKKAWAYTTIGVVFTIASALTLSPEQGHELFRLTSELLKAIFVKLLT